MRTQIGEIHNIIQVVVVDDHPFFRKGLRDVLDKEADIEVIAESGDGQEALEMLLTTKADVVLMDVNLPGLNGLQVTRRLKNRRPEINVIILTAYDDEEQIPAQAEQWLLELYRRYGIKPKDTTFSPLTNREMEILELIIEGLSNKQIAFRLGISQQTVKNHVTSILAKLNLADRTQAAIYALRHGWVRLPAPASEENTAK